MRVEFFVDPIDEDHEKFRFCTDSADIANDIIDYCLFARGIGFYMHPVSDDVPLNDESFKRIKELDNAEEE